MSAAAVIFLAGGAAWGADETYRARQTGNWNDYSGGSSAVTWEVFRNNAWAAVELEADLPGAGDTIANFQGFTVTLTDARSIKSLTVDNGQLVLDGESGAVASLTYPAGTSSPLLSMAAADDVRMVEHARIQVEVSMSFTTGGTGSLKGEDGDTCEIKLDGTSAAVTLTSNVLIHGALKINGTSGGTEAFVNNLQVVADIPGQTMHLGDQLNSVSNGSDSCGTSAAWQANGSTGSGPYVRAQLKFGRAASGLGYFYVNQGELLVDRVAVSATGKTLTGSPVGIVTTIAGGSFSAPDCP
jgi:hypothetical protein